MNNSTNTTSNVTNNFNMVEGSSISLTMVIQGSQTPEAQCLTQLQKAAVTAMIEETAALSRRVYRDNAAVEARLELIAAKLRLL